MQVKLKRPLTVLLLSGWTVSGFAALEDSLLLYAPFDGSVEATVARGNGTPTVAVPPEFRPGVRGRALVVGGVPEDRERTIDDLPAPADGLGRNVCFSPEGNIDVQQGTVSFWVKPLDWSGADGGFNVLFRTQAGRNYFMLYKFFHGERLLMLIGKDEKWTSAQHRIGHWMPGQWRHVAATWNRDEQRLFIDGVLACVRKRRFPLEAIEPVEPISVGPGGSWAKGFIGHSLIDELRIHDRPLSHAHVMELYRRDADAVLLDAGHVTVGRGTPRLDGRVDAFEYPFLGTGFNDLRGMAAQPQGVYALGYDAASLYVAMRTAIQDRSTGNDEQARDDNRIELFLSPAPGHEPLRHLVFTPEGTVRAGGHETGTSPADAVRVEQSLADGDWTLEAAIPFAALGLEGPPEGRTWRFNLARGFADGATVSVAPVIATSADRAKFMELRFRADAPSVQFAGLYDMQACQSALDVAARADAPDVTLEYVGVGDNINNPAYGLNTHRHLLFAEGRETPLRAPRPPATPWQLPAYMLHETRLVETRGEQKSILYRARFVVRDESDPLVTRFMYTLERRRLSVSAERRADGDIRVRFLDADGGEVWRARQPIPEAGSYFDAVFDLDFAVLQPGDYVVHVDHVAPDGTATVTYEQEYRIPGPGHPAFQPYVDPEADQPPAPWTPVEISGVGLQVSQGREQAGERAFPRAADAGGQQSAIDVSIWGRKYGFGEGLLFDSLISQDEQLLAAPPMLRLNGEILELTAASEWQPGEASAVAAELTQRADLGALRVESHIKTHFDGYCEIAMTLLPPAAGLAVKTLALDVPLRADAAELVRDGFLSSLIGSKSGAIGDYWHQRLVNGPFFWVGNDRVGFNWLAPDLEAWHSRHHDRNLELIRQGDQVLMRFNLVDTGLMLAEPRTIRFGFTLTPSRPLDPAVLRRREFKDYQLWCQPWQYFAFPDYDTADTDMIDRQLARAEPGADQVFLYGGDFLSPFHPDWIFWEQEWRFLRPQRTYGEWTGDFALPAMRRRGAYTEACAERETFRNFYLNAYRVFTQRSKEKPLTPEATGYYFDSGIGVGMCENPHHGCSVWTGLDGRQYGRVSIDALREIRLNLYRMIKRTGPHAWVYYHQGFLRAMPMQHFADMGVGGEGVSGMVSEAGGYFDVFTPEMFRATFSPQIWGMKMVHLDMYVRNMRESNPDAYAVFSLDDPRHRKALLHSYGYCVVHDVDIYDNSSQSRPLRLAIWAAQDALGWDPEIVFHPYWENAAVKRLGEDVGRLMASAYTKDGRMILAVLNDTDDDREIDLTLDLDALGVEAGAEGHDAFEPERRYTLDARWSDSVPPRGFRMVLWE